MSYPKKRKSWRQLFVGGNPVRWRLIRRETDSLLKLQGAASAGRQAIVMLRDWRDVWLSLTDRPNEPALILPKFVSQAAAFALENGWNADEPGAPVYFQYRQGRFAAADEPAAR